MVAKPKTVMVTKLKNSKCDKTEKLTCDKKNKKKKNSSGYKTHIVTKLNL